MFEMVVPPDPSADCPFVVTWAVETTEPIETSPAGPRERFLATDSAVDSAELTPVIFAVLVVEVLPKAPTVTFRLPPMADVATTSVGVAFALIVMAGVALFG